MTSRRYTLASGVTGTGAQAAVSPENADGRSTGIVQFTLSSTGTVQIQGSLDGTNFSDLLDTAVTASGLKSVVLCPHLRANISANAGTININLIG